MIGGCIGVAFATAYRLKLQRKGLRMSRVSVFTSPYAYSIIIQHTYHWLLTSFFLNAIIKVSTS